VKSSAYATFRLAQRPIARGKLLSDAFEAILPYFPDHGFRMAVRHKNKTFSTLLALVFGGLGLHRFYLRGLTDPWGWLHMASVPLSVLLWALFPGRPLLFVCAPLVLSALGGVIETLVTGLTPDEQWDARHNKESGKLSDSGWPVVALLVLALGGGATGLIAAIARTFDLLITGGSYG
jgi:TM2 domain-containing membrane protein YozV